MRISDWSSDVCSSDLFTIAKIINEGARCTQVEAEERTRQSHRRKPQRHRQHPAKNNQHISGQLCQQQDCIQRVGDRKSVVEGKSVSVRVSLGGRRSIKKKNKKKNK